jgi:hypothetical protein
METIDNIKTKKWPCLSTSYRQKRLDFEYTKVPEVTAKCVHHCPGSSAL